MEVLVGSTFAIDGSDYRRSNFLAGDASESSSSIGTPDDSDIDLSPKTGADLGDEEDEVQSKFNGRVGLGSLDSLEDSLPIKLVPFFTFDDLFDSDAVFMPSARSFLSWIGETSIF